MRAALAVFVLAISAACGTPSTHVAPSPFPGSSLILTRAIVETAMSLEGRPYRLGGSDPQTGFDCSGLVRYVLGRHAIAMPRTVAEQYERGRAVGRGDLRPGDLVFFSTVAPGASHVGILLADRATFLHAPSEGGQVRRDRLDGPYWRSRWVGARRVIP
jgi:cell wall-associated NlpC family hydrolase